MRQTPPDWRAASLLAAALAFAGTASWAAESVGTTDIIASQMAATAVAVGESIESPLTFTAEADFNSRYIWRGLAFSSGAVVQPSLAIGYQDFTLTAWGNYDLDGTAKTPRWNETDLNFGWSHEWEHWTFGATVQSYMYPHALHQPSTVEVALQGGYKLGEFEFSLRQTMDVAAYPGSYYGELVPTWRHEISKHLELSASVNFAWSTSEFTQAYAGVAAGGSQLLGGEAALKWTFAPRLSLRPHIGFSHLLNDAVRNSVQEPDFVWGGVAITLELP